MSMIDPRFMPREEKTGPDAWGMFSDVGMMLGPALMAYGFNMPQLGMIGPQIMAMKERGQERAAEREQREQWQNILNDPQGAYAALTDPQRQTAIQLGPEAGPQVVAEWVTPQQQGAPKTAGGGTMMWDQGTGSYVPIPGALERAQAVRTAGAPQVNLGDKEDVKAYYSALPGVEEAAAVGDNMAFSADQMEQLLEQGLQTGSLRPGLTAISALGADLGIDVPAMAEGLGINLNNPVDEQTFQRLSSQFALDMSQQLKGQISERELTFLQNAVAGLGRTPEDNARAVAALRMVADRLRAKRDIFLGADGYKDALRQWSDYQKQNPLKQYVGPSDGGQQGGGLVRGDDGVYRFQ